MRTERLEFEGHDGSTLAARLDMPVGKPAAYALFAHCFTCSKDIPAARRIAQRLASLGIAVLRFDFTGLGHSGGEFSNTGFSSNVEDLLQAVSFLRERYEAPQLLIGHSLGGAAILAAAIKVPEAKAVVTLGAPAEPEHVLHNFGHQVSEICSDGQAEVNLGGRAFTIKRSFVSDISQVSLEKSVSHLKKALLVMHAPLDETVGLDNAAKLFQMAKHPKSFVTLDNADHLLTRAEDAEYAAELISAWVQRYIDVTLLPKLMNAPEGITRVSEADPDSFTQDLSAAGHHLIADEPASYGGSYLGPTPYQLVAAGLGACTSMTIRMYARQKEIPLEHVQVDVSHDKVHAQDCTTCEQSSGKVDQFIRQITLTGDLTEEQRKRLHGIADRCPVHKTLEGEINIKTVLI
ncbi:MULTISPECIES: bifunctional alpha/beta hydrolase/OsmC family protein [unclassified Neptuniibacter]|uniref:bifunctional alpha/beta hydrolase/OsmC family protein n=1 Tax=unclassified Neptuniibacter TaxID=2630693 RepID=UPI000C3B648F|nr:MULTISPECIES: bifunctional alpha/beta hydrolase/OsmC family protein [unclassified Neptuniibacter]MAY41746.1 osmotically inducible protein C [Oceanospirillaceae bacterium]|tara:strand:- start:13588 stop:14802 length:1215 start_codon:yes stop_codon:yes gene_type:complete